MKIEEWLGQDNQLGMDIWKNKYCQDGEDFEQWLERISGGNREIAQLIREKKFLFGGRILSNRGLENQGRKVSLSNCYVVTPPEDNIESIFECAKKLARTYSCGKRDQRRRVLYGAVFSGNGADRTERTQGRTDDLH